MNIPGDFVEDGDEWIGLLSFIVADNELEITSLDSLREGQGVGSRLLTQAIEEARTRNCRRIFLTTTNDNLHALGFYQKRGFELVTIHSHTLDETRKLKPDLPLIGMNSIPLRDEIELEMNLQGRNIL